MTLGFSGAGGVGRPFTIQDLFSAVSSAGTSSSSTSSTASSVINQYLDESDSVTIVDVFTTSAFAPIDYDTGTWTEGVWT